MSLAASYSIAAIFSAKDKLSPAIARIEKRYGKFAGNVGRTIGRLNKGLNKALKIGATAALAATIAFTAMATREFIALDTAVTQAGAKFKDLNTTSADYAQNLDNLQKKAREVAAVTEFMASDAAGALDKMAMAGLRSDVSMSLLMGTTNLATAAGTDLTTAVDIATDSMGAFGLSMDNAADAEKNLNRISDIFAKTTTTANTDLNELFESVGKGAAVFTESGQSMETFAAFTGVLSNAAIKGSEAGTALRNVMLRLAKPTGEAADLIKQMGVQTADSQGNFRDVIDIIADFEKGLKGMGTQQRSAALKTIFGDRAITSFNLLLAEGSEGLRTYRTDLENSEGAATKMADSMRGSIANRIAILKSSVTELGLQFVESFAKDGMDGIQRLTKAVQSFDMTPITNSVESIIQGVKNLNALVEKIGGWSVVIKIILALAIAIKIAAIAMGIMNIVMMASPVTWIILGIVAAIAILTAAVILVRKHWEKIKISLSAVGKKFMEVKDIFLSWLGPIGWMINIVIDLIARFGEIKDAFKTEGIIAGIRKIGQIIFEALIAPFTQFLDLIRKVLPGKKQEPSAPEETPEERQERIHRGRTRFSPNAQEEESRQERALSGRRRGVGTITVKSEDGVPLEVDSGTMDETGWDMQELGQDTA